ncbi:MAG: hypothetical protein Q8L27_02830, partial [archaeon]|nr:hypothetical protein [archaeon]
MVEENAIKEAFARIKNDIFLLGDEIYSIRSEILDLKTQINAINESLNDIKIDILDQKSKSISIDTPTHIPTHPPQIPAIPAIPTDIPTVPVEVGGLKPPNLDISTRNGGVPTDRQTNQQTDISPVKPLTKQINDASEILDSLDAIKKELRLKFQTITQQEMLVFSTIYQVGEQ